MEILDYSKALLEVLKNVHSIEVLNCSRTFYVLLEIFKNVHSYY